MAGYSVKMELNIPLDPLQHTAGLLESQDTIGNQARPTPARSAGIEIRHDLEHRHQTPGDSHGSCKWVHGSESIPVALLR